MEQEVGIISWLIYFLLDNKSLSVYTDSTKKQSLSLSSRAKLHLTISSTIGNSKKLNSIIARALDEISEQIDLTNNLASIIVDDSLLSHSIIVGSKKYEHINEQIKDESAIKWGDKASNYYFISEEKKTPKNIFHSVAIHRLLREKIKLNFNNFGLSIKYIVPLSSILISSLKPSQFSVIKNGKKYQFFGNTKKGFMFFKLSYSGSRKVEEKIIGLLDIPNIKKSELDKNNLKYIFFNTTKIVEYLANYIFKDVPLLNFAESNSPQIFSGELKVNNRRYSPSSSSFKYDILIKNFSSGFLSLLFLLFVLSIFSNYNFLNFEDSPISENKSEVVVEKANNQNIPSTSMILTYNLLGIEEKFSELNTLLLTESEFIVNGTSIELDQNDLSLNYAQQKINFNELLIGLFEIENNLKFKVFENVSNEQSVQNIVLKFESFESLLNALSELIKFENISLVKAFKDDNSDSLHLYISILNYEN